MAAQTGSLAKAQQINFDDVSNSYPLFLTYIRRFHELKEFYSADPRQGLDLLIDTVLGRQYLRQELADILLKQMRAFAPASVPPRAALLARGDALVVITGQQVGLFGGPLYTLYKALTAIKLGQYLEEKYKKPVISIFWMVSEDHDLGEVDHASIVNKAGELLELKWQGEKEVHGRPALSISLGDEIEGLMVRLDQALNHTEFKDEVLARLQEAYGSKESFVTAFAKWIYHLLGHYGLIVVDPADPALKRLASPLFESEIKESAASLAATAGRRLEENGYSPQIEIAEKALSLFYLAPKRVKIIRDGDQFHLGSRRVSGKELERIAREEPQLLSPNVLLTPVTQSYLFPVVACVAGPGEISYYAQLKEVYAHFGLPMPVVFPRQSLTLLERRTGRFLEREGIELGQLLEPRMEMTRRTFPKALDELLQRIKGDSERNFASLAALVAKLDPGLAASALATKNAINYRISLLEKKIVASQRKKEGTFIHRLALSKNLSFPKGQLQERVLNFTPYLIKYGWGFIQDLLANLDLFCWEHRVYRL